MQGAKKTPLGGNKNLRRELMQRQYPPLMSYLIVDQRVVGKQCEVLQKLDLKEY